MRITDPYKLTPVEKYNGILFKRDDLFLPYYDIDLGGGKVRQMMFLMSSLQYELRTKYKGFLTYCSSGSPQSLIVAKAANEKGLRSVLCSGGKTTPKQLISRYRPIRLANELGCEVRVVSKGGYGSNVAKPAKVFAERENLFIVQFGIESEEHIESITKAVADQVFNIPDRLDVLVVPTGSGMTLFGILLGIHRHNKKVKRVIAIQISDKDRTKSVNKLLDLYGLEMDYEFILDDTYKYQKKLKSQIAENFDLNMVYESKAYEYLQKHKADLRISSSDRVLFWCVGNNNVIY